MSLEVHTEKVEVTVNAGIWYEPAIWVQIYSFVSILEGVIFGTSKDYAQLETIAFTVTVTTVELIIDV